MTKIAKRILLVFCSFVFVLCFGVVGVLGLNTNKTIEAKAATAVTFVGVEETQNNVTWPSAASWQATYLNFEGGTFTGANGGATSGSITYTRSGEGSETDFVVWSAAETGQLQLLWETYTPFADGSTIHIEEGTVVDGLTLPEVTLEVVGGKWQAKVSFSHVHETYNNVEWEASASFIATYVVFKNANFSVSTDLVDDITYTVPGGTAQSFGFTWTNDYTEGRGASAGPDTLNLMISGSTPIPDGSVLNIPQGTVVAGVSLPQVTLYAVDGKWQTEAPVVEPTVTFTGVDAVQNNVQWGTGQFIGVFLNFSEEFEAHSNLVSSITYTPVGGTTTSFGFTWANYGGLGAANQLQLLISGLTPIADGAVLNIPKGTEVGGQVLPEVTLYMVDGKWQKEKPAPIVNGFTAVEGGSIRIDRENGGLRFETHLEKATYDSLVATYGKDNLKIGTYILPEAWLTLSGKSLYDYVTAYTADGGYYLDISTWNETKNDFGFANSDKDGNITDGESYYKYYGTISKVKYENYLENFIGVGYLWITDQNDNNWLYLTHDGSWSRNVYEIAKAAYQDTVKVADSQLYGVTPYFDKVIAITTDGSQENGLIDDIDSVLTARPLYSYTKPTDYTVTVADGVITVVSTSNTVYNVLINGEKAGVIEANGTAYADYYAVTPELFATAEDAKALNFGFGEPTQELWGALEAGFDKTFGTENLNNGSTATNIAKVNKEYNGNTARIWFQIADVCWPNTLEEFAFLDGSINAIQGVVNDFRTQGVTNIALMSGVANYRSTRNYYKDGTWYTFWEAIDGSMGATPYPNLIVLPNEDDYQDFLALQKEYFKQIALNVKGITTIEILNELETSMLNQTRFGIANGYAPDIDLVAQAAMDICKAATDGVKEAGKNIKIMMPALCCVNEMKNGENVTRYDSVKLLEAEYAYIMGENGTKNADDYFQIINIHPYVSISSDTSDVNYLYYEDNGLTLQTPTQIKERWVAYMDSLRAIFVKNGDAEKPVWITEFGIADYESCNAPISGNKWSDYRSNKVLRQAQVFQVVYDAIMDMPYIDSVLFFRVGDYAHTEHDYATCGEATYGMIDEKGNVKDIGKYMYAIVNGVNVFTDNSYGTLKALDSITMLDDKQSITDFEKAVEEIY